MLENKYYKWYYEIIYNAKKIGRTKTQENYFEKLVEPFF
jgi:hypothetical protein